MYIISIEIVVYLDADARMQDNNKHIIPMVE